MPRVTVATIVVRGNELLFVEEESPQGLVLNQPAGHLEPGESLLDAAARETLEESAWSVRLTHLVGIYQWRAPGGRDYVRVGFVAEPLSHDPVRELDDGIRRALWLTPAQMRAERDRLRSPMVERLVDDWLGGSRFPLAMARTVTA
ncbi:NUDIX hydrolase [Xanthomonadaceae bacterium JHOS43]|nr:NUDIX hydrolase [Xanthomonadaceae bacterium JHOS43]MCX7563597.1 NUDIX hydrolase [Xanthomonadaceae bacterium XH05]